MYLVQPKEKLDEFLDKMRDLGHDTSAFNERAMDQETIEAYEASQRLENPHRLQFDEGKQFTMIEQEAFYDFLDQHFEPKRAAFGGKPDGASLIVGLAKNQA